MRCVHFASFMLLSGLCFGHPGNGIVALSADSVLTGDAVGNGIWRFTKGKPPERLASKFHCHWVTRGADGRIYAENLHETGGSWESAVYRLDKVGGNPEPVLRNREMGNLMFAVSEKGSFLYQSEGGLSETTPGGKSSLWKKGELREVGAYVWDGSQLYMADGDLIRSISTSGDTIMVRHRITGTVIDPLYASSNRAPRIWGLAVGASREIYAAVPSLSQVIRIETDGSRRIVTTGAGGWQPVGVATYGRDLFILESRTVGRENEGPRVKVIRADGQVEMLGEVKR